MESMADECIGNRYRKYVARVAGIVFNLAIRFKVIKPWTDIESGSGTSQHTGTPGGARAEAERRRFV